MATGSTIIREARAVRRLDKGVIGVLDLKKERFPPLKWSRKMDVGSRDETHQKSCLRNRYPKTNMIPIAISLMLIVVS